MLKKWREKNTLEIRQKFIEIDLQYVFENYRNIAKKNGTKMDGLK